MGLFSSGGGSSTMETVMMIQEIQKSQADQLEADELKKKQELERSELKKRGKNMEGGGRQGLMFGRNQEGVA